MARKKVGEGKYSKVTRRMWNDASFKRLTPLPPSGQSLWVKLLTAPYLTSVPGLFSQRQSGMAEDLGWSLEDFRRCWDEVAREEMAFADWSSGLVWVPNAIRHNEPESIYVVEAWEATLLDLPECALKTRALEHLEAYFLGKGGTWYKAWRKATRKVSGMPSCVPSRMASSIQEQEQEQDQDPPVIPPTESRRGSTGSLEPRARPSVSSESSKQVNAAAEPDRTQATATNPATSEPVEVKPVPAVNLAPPTRRRLEDITELGELCRALELNPHNANHHDVKARPEIVQVHEAYCRAVGVPPRRLGAYGKDPGVRAIVALFALDYSLDEVLKLVQYAPKDPWIMGTGNGRTGRVADTSALTPAKAGELLVIAKMDEKKRAKAQARLEAEKERARIEAKENADAKPPSNAAKAAIAAVLNGSVFEAPKSIAPCSSPRFSSGLGSNRVVRSVADLDRILDETPRAAHG